jgi:hypothetical protein
MPSRAAPLVLATLLASCTAEAETSCPGETVGVFAFTGTSPPLAASAAELDPDPSLTTCAVALGFPATVAFDGTLAADPVGSAAALCRSGPVFFGTHTGARWDVEAASDGAVLAACGSTCAGHSRTIVRGDVGPDPSAPTSFQGALVEQLTASGGDCSGCALPCAARYALTGTAEAPP